MSPKEIRALLEATHPELKVRVRQNPDGYSFFFGPPRGGSNPNRIIRAVSAQGGRATSLKLAISSRLGLEPCKAELFTGTPEQLLECIDKEICLFHLYFSVEHRRNCHGEG